MRTLSFLIAHLGTFRRMFWLLLVVGALDGIASFTVPILLAEFTKAPLAFEILPKILPLIITCLIASLFFQWCLRSWGECLTGWFGNELRLQLLARTERLSLDALSRYHSGYLASLINQVAVTVGAISSSIVWLVGHLVTTLSLFVFFTARESISLAITNLAILSLFVTVSIYLSRKIVPLAEAKNKTQAVIMERFVDILTNISTVKKLAVVDWVYAKLKERSVVNDGAIFTFQRFHANRWCLLHGIFHVSFLSTIAFILYQVEHGGASASIIILFIAGFARVQNQAERLSEMIKGLLETDAYVGNLEEILASQRTFGEKHAEQFQELECCGVVHRHSDSLQTISVPAFTLRAGDRIFLSGPSGQGKSTFLSIIAHQRIPTSGGCFWNGSAYAEFDESLARSFALVSQEAELFNLSLRENLSMAGDITDEQVVSVLHELGLDELLRSLPEGLDTKVGEKGLRLSSGQKQRINIARALLLSRPILLLDEPTSHLDSASEEAVIRCLSNLSSETTLVIVSHQERLKSLCNRHCFFVGGELQEGGVDN